MDLRHGAAWILLSREEDPVGAASLLGLPAQRPSLATAGYTQQVHMALEGFHACSALKPCLPAL